GPWGRPFVGSVHRCPEGQGCLEQEVRKAADAAERVAGTVARLERVVAEVEAARDADNGSVATAVDVDVADVATDAERRVGEAVLNASADLDAVGIAAATAVDVGPASAEVEAQVVAREDAVLARDAPHV